MSWENEHFTITTLIAINYTAFTDKRLSQTLATLGMHIDYHQEIKKLFLQFPDDEITTHHIIYKELGWSMGKRNEILLPSSIHKALHQQYPQHLPHEQIFGKAKKTAKRDLELIYKQFSKKEDSNKLIEKVLNM